MTKQIVVATDGSDHAVKALDMAADLAAQSDGVLTIVHVLMHGQPPEELNRMAEIEHLIPHAARTAMPTLEHVPATMMDMFQASTEIEQARQVVEAIGEKLVEDAAEQARRRGAKQVQTRIEIGDYAETILAVAKDVGADMIVLGNRGLGDLKGLLMGSVSHKVGQLAECTIVTVK